MDVKLPISDVESQVMKIKAYQLSSKPEVPEVPDHEFGDMDWRSDISTFVAGRKESLRSHTFAATPFGRKMPR